MKTLDLEQSDVDLRECVAAAQQDSILITRSGKPAALVLGVEGYDLEDLRYMTDAEFWKTIEESRRQPAMSRTELDGRLRKQGARGGKK